MCTQISSLEAVWLSLLLTHCVDLDVRLYYATVQNLVYGCGNVPQTTAKSSNTPVIHCAQHVQQSVDMSIQLSAGLQCNPVQMAEVVSTGVCTHWRGMVVP